MRVILDWDGTVTERDTQLMALEHFGDPALLAEAEEGLIAGRLTLHECIELEFSGLRAPLDEVVGWLLAHARIRPGFHELAQRHRPLILSTSFEQVIRPVLEREGVDLELVCNSVEPRADGWRPIWRDDAVCAECKEVCKRGSLPANGRVVYVGDGWSDRCAALAADRVFARDGLATWLRELNVPFEPLTDFHELAARL
jgi:2-hydroxy-3-keto-5-methylthiopentenyl-1-phosphate phosphatase